MSFTKYPPLRTPIDTLNVISCGGLRQGTFTVMYGRNACFTGDTRIKLLDGMSVSLQELSTRTDDFWVYSYDRMRDQVVPGRARFAQRVKKSNLVRVTLTDGTSATCTSDHLWLTIDWDSLTTEYVKACDLRSGMSCVSTYFIERMKGYECMKSTQDNKRSTRGPLHNRVATHQLIASEIFGADACEGMHVHHINHNRYDNRPDNLSLMTHSEHTSYHALHRSDETKRRISESCSQWWESAEGRDCKSRLAKLRSNYNRLYHPRLRPDVTIELIRNVLSEYKDKEVNSGIIAQQCSCAHSFLLKVISSADSSWEKEVLRAGAKFSSRATNLSNKWVQYNTNKNDYLEALKSSSSMEEVESKLKINRQAIRLIADFELGLNKYEFWDAYCSHFNLDERPKGYNSYREKVNHEVKSVELLEGEHDVYDISVDNWNNFLIDLGNNSGVYVHNSGKSASSYQLASYFLADNPTGIVHILDAETSTDEIRLKYTFGLDMGRVKIVGVDDLEQGFSYINEVCAGKHEILIPGRKMYRDDEILNAKVTWLRQVCQEWEATWDEALDTDRKRILADLKAKGAIANPGELRPHLIIWDSISASSPRLEMDAAKRSDSPMNAGGMGLTARVLKTNLKATATVMYGKPVTVILLAQVMLTDFGSYQGPSETFAGGSALKHYCHYILYYEFKKKLKNDGELTNHGTQSRVYIEKSKFSPTSQGVWIVIDDTLGGRIVQREEAIVACIDLGIISGSGWYKFKDEPDMKSMRFNDMVGNEEIRKKCIDKLAKYYRMNYLTIDMMYKEAGNTLGELSEDERNQKWSNSLIKLDDELFVKSEDKKND